MSDKPNQINLNADQISMLMLVAALDPDEPLELQPRRPLLYTFQHLTLRDAVFQNHPELLRELELAEPPSSWPLLHFWSRAELQCEQAGFADDSGDDGSALTAESEWLDAVNIHPYARDGYTAHIVTMPTPESSTEAYFVAMVFKDDERHEYGSESPSSRYFTLEKAYPPAAHPLICEWLRDGSRRNHGEGCVPMRNEFCNSVFDLVFAGGGRGR